MVKRFLLIVLCIFLSSVNVFADTVNTDKADNTLQESAQVQADELLIKVKHHRNSIYEKLDLTSTQVEKIQKLDQNLYKEMQPELKKLSYLSKKTIEIANSGNCTKKAINDMKKDFQAVEKDMNSVKNDYEKELKTILTKEQRSKYRKIRNQKRAELKKEMQKEVEKQKNLQKEQSSS